jgi:EAL domain-containing protein (putative c-di-GMP-specific phosphodiesterase class I)
MRAEEDVTAERGRLAAVIESLPFDFWVCDASGRYLLQNSYGRRLWADHTGLLPKETRAPAELPTHWTDTNRRALAGEIIHTEWSYDFAGKTVHVEEILAPIRNADGTIWGISGVNLDIGERKRAEMRLAEAEARLRAAIESLPFDFWVCDADGRHVMTNATCREHWGTYLGKRPLESGVETSISGRWERENRRVLAGETLRYEASYGAGETRREVEAIVEGLRQPDSARLIARRILAELRQPCALGEQDLPISACIGLATFPPDAASAAELLKHADIALYRAKRTGRGQSRHFAAEMRAELDGRRQLDAELRRAVENHEFTVLYQPILELGRPSRVSFEALLRWRHPDRGLLAPAEFLHLAEETGLIVPIGRTVLDLVAGQARRWSDAGVPLGRVAINVANAQFTGGNLDEAIAAVLVESDASSWQLEVEVTESVFVGRHAGVVEQLLQRLRRRGVSIALDDFGTGYASLTHLRRFPIDRLKIDRSFVRGILHSPNDATIVGTIIELGHSLDLEIVAEGVETREQLDFLRRHRCDHIQGYLIATPAPAEEALRHACRQAEHLLA